MEIMQSLKEENNRLILVGCMDHTLDHTHESANRVYSVNGICPTINTCGGGSLQPKILVKVNKMNTVKIKQATTQGYIECDLPGVVDLEYPESETRRGRVIDRGRVSPTLCTSSVPSLIEAPIVFENRTDEPFRTFNDNCCGALRTTDACGDKMILETDYKIRKLTPRECWRLMGFRDADFDAAQKVNSNTQLYKQAGNSIVVNCLEDIFQELF